MTVRIDECLVHLEGVCPVGDAEPLLAALQAIPEAIVDLGGATRLHLAVVQLLLAAGPLVQGVPADPFLRDHILTRLRKAGAQDALPRAEASI